jgi:hypothetical protein
MSMRRDHRPRVQPRAVDRTAWGRHRQRQKENPGQAGEGLPSFGSEIDEGLLRLVLGRHGHAPVIAEMVT